MRLRGNCVDDGCGRYETNGRDSAPEAHAQSASQFTIEKYLAQGAAGMPCTLTWEPRCVCVKFSGTCSIRDVIEAFEAISGDPRLDSLRSAIFDYVDVQHSNVTEREIERAVAQEIGIGRTNPRLSYATVATDERNRVLWQHFASRSVSPERLGLFHSVAEAQKWLAGWDQ